MSQRKSSHVDSRGNRELTLDRLGYCQKSLTKGIIVKKDLVAKVMAIVLLAAFFGWYVYGESENDIKKFETMSIVDVAKEAMTPKFESINEAILIFIALGVTIIIITELLGFFIRIIFFRKFDETNIIHNHNITLQLLTDSENNTKIIKDK